MSPYVEIGELNIDETTLNIAVSVYYDTYDYRVHSPKVTIVFETDGDNRRIPIPVASYEPDQEEGCHIFAGYSYIFNDIFWNIRWKECDFWFVVEYGEERYEKVPIRMNCDTSRNSYAGVDVDADSVHLSMKKEVDSTRPENPNVLQCILAFLLHAITAILGIFLLPWFVIDSLAVLLLHTEKGNEKIEGSFFRQFVLYVGWRYFGFCRNTKGITGAKTAAFKSAFHFWNSICKKKKTILFLSDRRKDLSGNLGYVYESIKDYKDVRCTFWLEDEDVRDISLTKLIRLGKYIAQAKIILVDDFTPILDEITIDPQTKIIQLWHACGAFKTFGFSRLGKQGGPKQEVVTHRYYDYAIVSSSEVIPYYAEGFGIADEKVLPLGIPRTDVFFSDTYKKEIRETLFTKYPGLKGKKVILFAPTFRGDGKLSAYYDPDKFDPNQFMEALPEDYVLIIKQHPFVKLKYQIRDSLKPRIFDFSKENEINDLLFITDLLITDYSSVIFEASLLDIPMIFYAYDLQEYLATRDLYFEYELYVPGPIVQTQQELISMTKNPQYDQNRMEEFKKKNYEFTDGRSTERVVQLILKLYKNH